MEGLSAKLQTFEDVSNNYMIQMEPRLHYQSAQMEQQKNAQMGAQKNLGMLRSNLLKKNPNLQKGLDMAQKKQQGVTNQNLSRMAQNFMQRSQGSASNLNSTKTGNMFRLSRGGKSNTRGMNNFDGNKLAGSSAFGNLGNTSKLGNSGNFFDNFNQNKRSSPFQQNQGFQGGYNTAPNMGGYMSPLGQSAQFGGQFDAPEMRGYNNQGDPNDIDMEGDELEFKYSHDFDENGALYWLGTCGKTANYTNPYTLGQVKVFFSSMGRGSYEDFVGRALVNCRTLNEPNAFMGIDFGPGKYLIPSCYTIKNRDSTRHVLLNWIFEVSFPLFTEIAFNHARLPETSELGTFWTSVFTKLPIQPTTIQWREKDQCFRREGLTLLGAWTRIT